MTNQAAAKGKSKKQGLPLWLIIILKTLRLLLIPALCVAALFIGLTVGYATIGGGDSSDVFKFETWKHLYNLVFAE